MKKYAPMKTKDEQAAEAFSVAALKIARQRRRHRPYGDGDTLIYGQFFADYPCVSRDLETQVRYWDMRLSGESHKMAELLAVGKFPAFKSDATFNAGRANGAQFETTPGLGDYYRGIAEAAGVSTTGRYYSAGLADFPGDPTAWVADRADVLRVAKDKGYKVSGDVEYDPGEREPMPDVAVAPEIVAEQVDAYMAKDPGERRADVEERITAVLTGAVNPSPEVWE